MSLRRTIVEVSVDGLNVTEFCAGHGISTWFFYDLRRRFREGGWDAIEPRPRTPGKVPNRTGVEVEDRIVALRKELVEAGLDAGAATISFHLEARGLVPLPSETTIWRILVRRGFVDPQPKKAPKTKGRRFEAERANECWQIDDTTWELEDGTEVKIVNVVDDRTRVLIASKAVITCTTTAAIEAFADGAAEWGWPARFLSDNAKAFRNGLADAMRALGIAAGHSRPHHPQTCGKVERFHFTLKQRLDAQPRSATLADLQAELDIFRRIYNHERPHKSLRKKFPADVWHTVPKDGPASNALNTPTRIHRGVVRASKLNVRPGLIISIGAAHDDRPAIVVTTGNRCHVFIDGRLARQLDIDPTRTYQPIHPRPGRPTRVP